MDGWQWRFHHLAAAVALPATTKLIEAQWSTNSFRPYDGTVRGHIQPGTGTFTFHDPTHALGALRQHDTLWIRYDDPAAGPPADLAPMAWMHYVESVALNLDPGGARDPVVAVTTTSLDNSWINGSVAVDAGTTGSPRLCEDVLVDVLTAVMARLETPLQNSFFYDHPGPPPVGGLFYSPPTPNPSPPITYLRNLAEMGCLWPTARFYTSAPEDCATDWTHRYYDWPGTVYAIPGSAMPPEPRIREAGQWINRVVLTSDTVPGNPTATYSQGQAYGAWPASLHVLGAVNSGPPTSLANTIMSQSGARALAQQSTSIEVLSRAPGDRPAYHYVGPMDVVELATAPNAARFDQGRFDDPGSVFAGPGELYRPVQITHRLNWKQWSSTISLSPWFQLPRPY